MQNQHKEIKFEGNFDTAIIFVHGILGSPNHFNAFITLIKGKCAIYNLLLPGHGDSGSNFAKSSMKKWQEYVDHKVEAVQRKYKKIILVGHSMGCLLLVQTALTFPDKISGIVFLAIPLKIRMTYRCMRNSLKVALNNIKNEDVYLKNIEEIYSIHQSHIFGFFRWIPRFLELILKSQRTRRKIKLLKLPLFVFQSKKDEIVGYNSIKYMVKMDNVNLQILEHSGHYYYDQGDEQDMLHCFEKLVNNLFGINE